MNAKRQRLEPCRTENDTAHDLVAIPPPQSPMATNININWPPSREVIRHALLTQHLKKSKYILARCNDFYGWARGDAVSYALTGEPTPILCTPGEIPNSTSTQNKSVGLDSPERLREMLRRELLNGNTGRDQPLLRMCKEKYGWSKRQTIRWVITGKPARPTPRPGWTAKKPAAVAKPKKSEPTSTRPSPPGHGAQTIPITVSAEELQIIQRMRSSNPASASTTNHQAVGDQAPLLPKGRRYPTTKGSERVQPLCSILDSALQIPTQEVDISLHSLVSSSPPPQPDMEKFWKTGDPTLFPIIPEILPESAIPEAAICMPELRNSIPVAHSESRQDDVFIISPSTASPVPFNQDIGDSGPIVKAKGSVRENIDSDKLCNDGPVLDTLTESPPLNLEFSEGLDVVDVDWDWDWDIDLQGIISFLDLDKLEDIDQVSQINTSKQSGGVDEVADLDLGCIDKAFDPRGR